MLWTSKSGKRVICALASESGDNLYFIKGLIEAGKYKSIVNQCFPMEKAAEAHRYAESGRKKGNVVITIVHEKTDNAPYQNFNKEVRKAGIQEII